ncbi:glycosyltransferase [Haliangium ochraceum]|uniref:Glycosyl transferase group 1 n=1 Tax=Haliangium ochraceum (strain DSM 14365 / JCM 11303 / SMP-2) TaxID=502025 RepID=D0LIR8_HALO1|nr:glycosyltransferase [Haliangium ochraceum]ACY12947.1 glycosyl transferase group 1 [Haliangium ochraceum DSM 14365]
MVAIPASESANATGLRLAIATDVRFLRDSEGRIHCRSGGTAYRFWQRYAIAFDEVRVLARVFPRGADDPQQPAPVEGPGVSVHALPGFDGPRGLARVAPRVLASIWRGLRDTDALVVRAPATVGLIASRIAQGRGLPLGVEVVGDPCDTFGPGGVGRGAAPFFGQVFIRDLRWQCRRADALAYVTASALQRRYPARADAFATHYSSVELDTDAIAPAPRTHTAAVQAPHLVTVGQLEQPYKGTDLLIEAVRALRERGLDARLTVVGDGRFRRALEAHARTLGVAEHVHFAGLVPAGAAVRAILDTGDLFVLPSRAEGLPRALIEAMARALPAIGSRVGGIPELLPERDLVPSENPRALADAIAYALADPARLDAMSRDNWERARRDYHTAILETRRRAFYTHLSRAAVRARP